MIHRRISPIVCLLLAAAAMGAAAATASASRGFSVTNGVSLASANGQLTMTGLGLSFFCTLSLGFDLNSSIPKSPGATLGAVLPSPGSSFSGCNLGITGTVLGGSLEYTSFSGTLPTITSLNATLRGFSFLWQIPILGQSCLYSGDVSMRLSRNPFTGEITTITTSTPNPLTTQTTGCPATVSFTGTLTTLATRPIYQLI